MNYHAPTDHQYMKNLRQAAPEAVQAFLKLDETVFSKDTGTLPVKTRELVAIAVALTTQCPYCIEAHTKAAKKAGASEDEIGDVVMITTALRAGAGFAHGWLAMKMYENS